MVDDMGRKLRIAAGTALVAGALFGLRACQTKDVPQGTRNVAQYDSGTAPENIYKKVETERHVTETYTGSHDVRNGEKLIDIIIDKYNLNPCKDGKKITGLAKDIVAANPKAFAKDSDVVAADGVKPCDKEHNAPYGGALADDSDGIVGDTMYAGAKLKLSGLTRPGTTTDVKYEKVDDVSKLQGGTELYSMKKGEEYVYTVKAGDTVWKLVADLCGIDKCNSSIMKNFSNNVVGANPDVFGNDSDTVSYAGVEPCKDGKRPVGAEKVDEADGIKGDKLSVDAKIKIPCKSTETVYEKAGVVNEEALPTDKKSNWLLWKEGAKEKGYWKSFWDTFLNFGSASQEAPVSDSENPDAWFLSNVKDHVKRHGDTYTGLGIGAGIAALACYAAYRIARSTGRTQGPNPPAPPAGAPRDARNNSGPRGKSEGIRHTYRGGSAHAESIGASAYLGDEGDMSVLEYIGSKTASRNSNFDSKLSKSAGMNARIAEAYKTMSAREVKNYFAGMGVKISETSVRRVARQELGAEYAPIANARSRANLIRGSGASINNDRMPAYATGMVA